MLIDWFTVGAQTLNFLILVWLLRRFLYQPILQAIDAREKLIAAELADADARKAEARLERDELGHKKEAFDQQRAALLTKATEEAKAECQRLIEVDRKQLEGARAGREQALQKERLNLSDEISGRTRDQVFTIVRKALGDLATVSLEDRMVEVLLRRLRALNDQERDDLKSAFKSAPGSATVLTTFDLSAEQQSTVKTTLKEVLALEAPLVFESVPALVSGIQVTANGHKIEWSIADYLVALEKRASEVLKPPAQALAAHS